ncbi:MAG: ABC transporter ATP-binding protein [Eubacteriales bacterium]|nr:ABC transporter ATP-binding protein [Eubacteriales bacterium]
MDKQQPVIEVKDLVKRYKEIVALDHLSLDVYQGDIFGLLGPNGSGKTTLINCMLALLRYDSGQIRIFGQDMTPASNEIKQQIGLVPQNPTVYNELTVYENIDYFTSLYVKDKVKRSQLVEEAIDFVQLGDFRKTFPQKLSGGLLRRLNLACGIAHKPRLLFLDEPTVAVDPQSRNRILEGIKELNRQGTTIVYTTHYMEEVEMICNRLAILDHGKVLQSGTSNEIISMSSIGETITVQIFDLPEAILTRLSNDPAVSSASYQNGLLKLSIKNGQSYLLTLLETLKHAGIEPMNISSKRPTLNDVFLEITGKELRDHA